MCARIFLDGECLQHATKLALDAASDEGPSLDPALATAVIDANLRADKGVGEALLEAAFAWAAP